MVQKSESESIVIFDKKFDHATLEADYIADKEKPLRTVVMLHTESVWIGMILLTIVIEFQIILYNVSFRGRLFNVTNEPREYSMQSYLIMMDALYCADFLLALSYRSWKSVSSISSIKPRGNISLTVDLFSLIPVDVFLWYGSDLAITNPRAFHSWSMNHLVRIYRVYGFFYKARHSIVHVSVQIHLLEILTLLSVLAMIATVAMFEWEVDIEKGEYGWLKNFVESLDTKNWKAQDWFWVSYYIVIGHISSHGTINFPPETNHLRFTIFAMVSALGIRSLLLAYMVDVIQRRDYVKSIFTLKRMILGGLLTSAVRKSSRDEIYKYYRFYWDTQMGQKFDIDTFFMYPQIFRAECSLELSWDTFKHSKLFREMPVPFLRNVSLLCKRRFVLPGDYILKKFELKDCLIYIVSGSVYVLSEEDNATPILSFSGGTIFGEVSLLASSRSRVSILACTPCELNVLKRNDFARIIVPTYPEIYQEIVESVNERISRARFTKKITIHLEKNENIFDGNRYTDVAWLKKTLNALQDARQVDNGRSQKFKERQDLLDQVYASSDIRYTFVYLDTMVLSNDLALTSDAVFLQSSKCPWILQPDSKVLLLWDIMVLICAIVLAYIIVVGITFHEFETEVIYAWINFLGILLTADLWVILSTAIQKNDRITITKVSHILKIRLHDWRFWFDISSAVPWTLLVSQLSNKTDSFRLMKLNRLLKLYKLEMMFTRIENSHKLSLVALRTIKYSIYISMSSFLLTAFVLMITCEGDKKTAICSPTSWISVALTGKGELSTETFSYSYLVILQTILGIGTPISKLGTPKECACWVVLIIISSLLFIFYIASLTSVRVLGQVVLTSNFHLGKAIRYHLNKTTVPSVLKKRVDSYLETELYYDKGYRLAMKEDVLGTLSPEVSAQWKHERFGHLVGNVPLFIEIGEGFIRDICSVVNVGVLPPRELLSYGGRRCTEMYIIEKGYCEMIHMVASIPHRKVGPGTAIYALEMCLQLPVVHTVVTLTYVSFLTINRSDFLRMYSNYPEDKVEFDNLLSEFQKMERVMELKEVVKEPPEFIEVLHSVRPPVPSFTFFVYTLNKEDPEYYVINEPFERLKNLKIIKWILLRATIRPDGVFMKFYEAQRCLCAVMTLVFYTMRIVIDAGNAKNYTLRIITFLNVAAVFDIYVRMHVGFFNEKGLLVTHPLATATNYMKSSMFVDVIAVIPFEQLILGEKASSTDLFYFYLTRVIQLYRVLGGINYLQESGAFTRIIKYGKFLPILIVVAHVFACVVLYNSCIFDTEFGETAQFGAGVRCLQERSFIEAGDEYKLTVWVLYRKSLYIAMSTLTRVGAEKLQIKTLLAMKIFYAMSSVTFVVLLFLMGQIMADSAVRDGELTAYQDRMTTMVKFLKNKKISPELYDEVVSYFELAWKHKRGQAVDQLLKTFHSALREDVLCALYSKSLSKNPGLVNSSETFYRYLLMNIKEVRFYPHGSVIVHYNDVLNFVVVIHTGSAEVVAPDGSLITSLGPGSIFGNLIGSTTVRMPISIVVTAHMEALIFNSNEFFRALSIHRKARKVFLDAMELNTDYIPGNYDEHQAEISKENLSTDDKVRNNATIFRYLRFLSIRVVDPNWLPIVLWDRNSLFFSCYLSPCAIIYQIAFGDFHLYWICFQYLTDFLFLFTIYLKVHSAYEDNHGNIVRDKKRIWIRFIKSPMGFYLHLASIFPIEVIAFLFQGKTFQKLYAWLRLNRTLRLAVVVDFFDVQCKRLNINIFNMRIAYLVTILFFTIHLASCIQANIMTETDLYEMDHSGRATLYFKTMYIVASLYSGSITRRLSANSPWYETFYILTLEIVIFVMFALIVGDMCAMIDVRHFVMITYERVIKRFKTYMETCDLTYVLRRSLWTYGCNLWEFNRGRQIPHLVLEAPDYLRGAIKNALFINHLENHCIFSGCHEDFLRQIAYHFILINFFDDDLIVNFGDINGDMYFINAGRVVTIHYEPFDILKENRREIFEEGESFGILSGLYPRYPHTMTHRAFGKCQILVLNRMKWYYLLKHFPASEKHIYSMAEKLRAQSIPVELPMSTD